MKPTVEREIKASADEIKRLLSMNTCDVELDPEDRKRIRNWLRWIEIEADNILAAVEMENKKMIQRRRIMPI